MLLTLEIFLQCLMVQFIVSFQMVFLFPFLPTKMYWLYSEMILREWGRVLQGILLTRLSVVELLSSSVLRQVFHFNQGIDIGDFFNGSLEQLLTILTQNDPNHVLFLFGYSLVWTSTYFERFYPKSGS